MTIEEQTYKLIDKTTRIVQEFPMGSKWVSALSDLKNRVEKPCTLAIVGRVKAGKSSFINVLLGKNLAKVGELPTTATINKFRYGHPDDPTHPISVYWNNENGEYITHETLEFMESLQGQDDETLVKAEGIEYLEYVVDDPILKDLILVDTPGIDAIVGKTGDAHQKRFDRYFNLNQKHNEQTHKASTDADAVIYIVGAVAGVNDKKMLDAFIESCAGSSALNAIGVMSKVDVQEEVLEHRHEQAAYVANSLKDQLSDVIPVSSAIYEIISSHRSQFAYWQQVIKAVPNELELDLILTQNDIFTDSSFNTYMPKSTAEEIASEFRTLGWSIPRTVLKTLYRSPDVDSAVKELNNYANIDYLKEVLNEQFFQRTKVIHCSKILYELHAIVEEIFRDAIYDAQRASEKGERWISEIKKSIVPTNPIVAEELQNFLLKSIKTPDVIEQLKQSLTTDVKIPLEKLLLLNDAPIADYAMRKELQSTKELWDEDDYAELWNIFGVDGATYIQNSNKKERQMYWQSLAMQLFDRRMQTIAEHAVEIYGRL